MRIAELFSAGRYAELENLARLLVERQPGNGYAWKVLGVALSAQGKEPLPALRKAAELLPDDAEAHLNLGKVLVARRLINEAEAHFREALRINREQADAHNNAGNALREQGQLEEALSSYRRALELRPDLAELHANLGVLLLDLDRFEEAAASCRRAIAINPAYVEAHASLGIALHELGRLDEALASCSRALEIRPDYAEAHSDSGIILQALGQIDEAVAAHRRALTIHPEFVEAHSNLGIALSELGELPEATASFRRALELNPGFAVAHFNLGLCLLKMGQYPEGWREYEYRWTGGGRKMARPATALRLWTGQQPAPGERLLVFEEQGLGDRLQFVRYLALAAKRFQGRVSLVVDPTLRTLFHRSFPDIEILEAAPVEQGNWHWQCPLLSLPLAFETTLETIPGQAYLVGDPLRVAYWRGRIAELGLPPATRRIGVVWKAGQAMKNASRRSLALHQLAPLLNLPGCAWFSLQKEPNPEKARWVASGKLVDWAGELVDFDETAALAMNLDLVVSVDTAVAHLAGGLGLATWLFNRHASEWRWLRDREDSPWYPTLRIFTQDSAGDWDEVVRRMADALNARPSASI